MITEAEDEGLAIGPEFQRQAELQEHADDADEVAAEHGAGQAPHAADDGRDEADQSELHAHAGRKRAALHGDEDRRDAREDTAQRESDSDDPIGSDAEQTGHAEVECGCAHLHAEAGACEE